MTKFKWPILVILLGRRIKLAKKKLCAASSSGIRKCMEDKLLWPKRVPITEFLVASTKGLIVSGSAGRKPPPTGKLLRGDSRPCSRLDMSLISHREEFSFRDAGLPLNRTFDRSRYPGQILLEFLHRLQLGLVSSHYSKCQSHSIVIGDNSETSWNWRAVLYLDMASSTSLAAS
jgi:hypothetical protein